MEQLLLDLPQVSGAIGKGSWYEVAGEPWAAPMLFYVKTTSAQIDSNPRDLTEENSYSQFSVPRSASRVCLQNVSTFRLREASFDGSSSFEFNARIWLSPFGTYAAWWQRNF
jgi:hypothetical protein